MTDKEIVKALECCISSFSCDECPYHNVISCSMERDVLDLINRQQAEIDKYRQTVGTLAEKDGEVVGLLHGKETRYIKKDIAEVFKIMAVNTARAEAIKEFENLIVNNLIEQAYGRDYLLCLIKEWAKEMTEAME